jgi:UDP-3-O-[3-hydroxymyristoyl] N-acetylglucosamine deacetylase/3-hydroxyacyl-[acyl-carrier-protein] dehydratase
MPDETALDVRRILDTLPHRYPFLMIDRVVEFVGPDALVAIKNVSINEPYFQGHFPGNPVMPGVLQLEAMAQCGGILVLSTVEDPENYGTYFLKIDNTKFKDKVVPGDTMIMKMELMEPVRRGLCIMRGRAWVGEKLVCESEMMAQIVKIA